ncbi:unnamed protein product [Rotaria sordida]|uniref:VLIG-type G domain-containing protein n=2 Tax=Rotaria sordida TaxID=392033 RepID=A0A819NUM8_9BILA|nr:unnamed protein product [Rotaria sordida]
MNETYGTIIISGKQVAVNTSKAQIQNKIDKLSSNINFVNTSDFKLSDRNIKEVMMSSAPESWSIEQVAQWLESINMTAFIENFKQNEIDGSLLISDGLDDTLLKELIPQLKHRITFKTECMKLKSGQHRKSTMSVADTGDIRARLQSSQNADTDLRSAENNDPFLTASGTQTHKTLPAARIGTKATCPRPTGNVSNIHNPIDSKYLLQDDNYISSVQVDAQYFNADDYELLKKWSLYLCLPQSVKQSTGLDRTFNTLVDEAIDARTLVKEIAKNHSLKVYVVDSLKRYNSLMDIIHILSSCTELELTSFPSQHSTTIENIRHIADTITKSVLLTTTMESLSYESQRYFGNFIKKNDLPLPFSYYIWNEQKKLLEYKINFNVLAETMCLTTGHYILQIGSESTIGMGKTSLLQFIFPDKRIETLNTDGSSTLRNGCIDVLFPSDVTNQKEESYVIFDVHGIINALNEDIISSIQEFCALQIFYVTEEDLKSTFLNSMMNYSKHIQGKPMIIIIFDPNYDDKRHQPEKLINAFKLKYQKWTGVKWATAPPSTLWFQADSNKKNKDLARSQRLLKSLSGMRESLNKEIQQQIHCTSIFSIQSYYNTVKTSTNFSPPVNRSFQIENRLKKLFESLNDRTENLRLATPVSYLESAIKQCERDLENWDAPQTGIQARKDMLNQERSNIKSINNYTRLFIDLLTKCSYIELLITEIYLEKWRSQFGSTLHEQLREAKNVALKFSSQIKQLEQRLSTEENFNQPDRKKMEDDLRDAIAEFNRQRTLVTQIFNKLMNIDLTIGLFCDEILALYEFSPHLFPSENLIEDIAKTLSNLMLKGFAFHILRGRPLHCRSELLKKSISFIQTTQQPPLVLTVIGEQSSAKSSLLNTTFGCNFRVSAGRCTIGMYMSVIQWRSETFIIFDTEGLLSLEEAGSIFDNQMITMAMLSSHLVLINHKGEVSVNLKDLIDISFYAKLQIHSPIKPKLLFVLRDQADLKSKEIFFGQLTQLKEQLQRDTRSIKYSIDEEIDIQDENVYLLPNAFSHDANVISNIDQSWRNQIFPKEIIKLRDKIFNNIRNTIKPQRFQFNNNIPITTTSTPTDPRTPANDPAYTDMTHLYTKICSNWETIDRLGPRLLACKTLYEISIMEELQTIAIDIIQTINVTVHEKGENLINETLLEFSKKKFIDIDRDRIVGKFDHELSLIITHAIEQARKNFDDKTERSCYLPEMKLKISKRMEPPIRSAQHLLNEIFEERLLSLSKKARLDSAQQQLLNSVQNEFDENKSLESGELKTRVEIQFKRIIEQHHKELQSSVETESMIIKKLLKFYNNQLQSKQVATARENIYNHLSVIKDEAEYKAHIQKFENCLSRSRQETQQAFQAKSSRFLKTIKSVFTGSSQKPIDYLWKDLKNTLGWFTNDKKEAKNEKIFIEIWNNIVPKFEEDLLGLLDHTKSFSSDPKTVQHLLQYIENAMNTQSIINNSRHLEKPKLCFDLAVIGLSIIINKAIDIEQTTYKSNLQNSKNEMEACKDSLLKQCMAMKDSFELGQTLAETIGKQIIDEISNLLQRRIEKDITEDIFRSQFINHESIQKQAYAESIGQANGENIFKYVYDINRYFIELSLNEIRTTLHVVIHKHTLLFEDFIRLAIDKANEVVERNAYEHTGQLNKDIHDAILNLPDLKLSQSADTKLFQMFSLRIVVRMPIKDTERFKQGFSNIRNCYKNIKERVTELTKDMKTKAFTTCKQSIATKLGCQARCPGCGAKCSKPGHHEKEDVEVWQDPCKTCPPNNCTCKRPDPISVTTHETTYHLASAFHGWIYYPLRIPCLELCYQRWKTTGVNILKNSQSNDSQTESEDDDQYEYIFPKAKYYNEKHPAWYNDLNRQSIEGSACNESIPPPDQRRAWMVVRHTLINYHKGSMVDNKDYDSKLYPMNIETLPKDFEPKWKDETFE